MEGRSSSPAVGGTGPLYRPSRRPRVRVLAPPRTRGRRWSHRRRQVDLRRRARIGDPRPWPLDAARVARRLQAPVAARARARLRPRDRRGLLPQCTGLRVDSRAAAGARRSRRQRPHRALRATTRSLAPIAGTTQSTHPTTPCSSSTECSACDPSTTSTGSCASGSTSAARCRSHAASSATKQWRATTKRCACTPTGTRSARTSTPAEVDPLRRADVVIDNTDLIAPRIMRLRTGG